MPSEYRTKRQSDFGVAESHFRLLQNHKEVLMFEEWRQRRKYLAAQRAWLDALAKWIEVEKARRVLARWTEEEKARTEVAMSKKDKKTRNDVAMSTKDEKIRKYVATSKKDEKARNDVAMSTKDEKARTEVAMSTEDEKMRDSGDVLDASWEIVEGKDADGSDEEDEFYMADEDEFDVIEVGATM